jgi:HAD superfamily hydrolase (TIGR01509 family)
MDIPFIGSIDGYDAILFDLDGTLVDTMPLHHRAYQSVFRARGLDLEWAVFMGLVGAPARLAIPRFAQAAGWAAEPHDVAAVHAEKKAAFAANLAIEKPALLPAARLLAAVRETKRCALVTSGNRAGVEAILDALGWTRWFEAIVTGDDVTHGKPHPEPFLRAAEALAVAPAACLALEDTTDGLASARAAGTTAIDVTSFTRPGAAHMGLAPTETPA